MSEVVMSRRHPAALAAAWLLLAAACSGGKPGAQAMESAVEHGGGVAVLTVSGERAEGGAETMHPCQWEEWCVSHGGGVSLHCGGRWVCPASDQPGSTGALAVTTLRR